MYLPTLKVSLRLIVSSLFRWMNGTLIVFLLRQRMDRCRRSVGPSVGQLSTCGLRRGVAALGGADMVSRIIRETLERRMDENVKCSNRDVVAPETNEEGITRTRH